MALALAEELRVLPRPRFCSRHGQSILAGQKVSPLKNLDFSTAQVDDDLTAEKRWPLDAIVCWFTFKKDPRAVFFLDLHLDLMLNPSKEIQPR